MDWAEANRAFYDSGVWRTLYFRDRRICKFPTDLWIFAECIDAVGINHIIETGTYEGGSALWFAEFAPVVTVDVTSPPFLGSRVEKVTGESTDPDVVNAVYTLAAEGECLVSLDSDHSAANVEAEMNAYADFVAVGSYLVVEDTAIDAYGIEAESYPEGGPGVAVERFLAHDDRFVRDERCERFFLGMNPGGWLRRVR